MALVCGIDPSLTSTGVAILRDGRPVLLRPIGNGTLSIRSYNARGERVEDQVAAIFEAIDKRLNGRRIGLAGIEGAAYGAANASTHDGSHLWWEIHDELRHRRVPTVVIQPATRCLWATGKGGKESRELTTAQHKAKVTAAVRNTWSPWRSHITNHDVADGLTIAEILARGAGDPLHFEPERRHIEAMHNTIKWPAGFGPKVDTMQVGAMR